MLHRDRCRIETLILMSTTNFNFYIMNIKKLMLGIGVIGVLFTSCSGDDDNSAPRGAYDDGILIVNEGGFFNGNASVSFVSQDYSVTEQGIFSGVNSSAPLGDIAQSLAFYNELAYIVVNNSHKIEIVNRYTFESFATIDTGLNNPRYITFSGTKGYVTNWGEGSSATDDYVAIIDLGTNTVESTIPVGEGPEKILNRNGKLYVSHKGGWNQNNIVSVINIATEAVTEVTVGDVPDDMTLDATGNLWVLNEGMPAWTGNETAGSLMKINTGTDSVETTLTFATNEHPSLLDFENGNIYFYLNGSIYSMADTASVLPTVATLSNINTNPFSASMRINGNTLFFTDAADNASNGSLMIYNLSSGALIDSKTVGINPGGGIYFNIF